MEREQTSKSGAREFVELLKQLNKERQQGLYLIAKGMAVMAGEKKVFLNNKKAAYTAICFRTVLP